MKQGESALFCEKSPAKNAHLPLKIQTAKNERRKVKMKLAIKTCTLDMPYEEMLDFCVSQKIAAIEIGTGNWSGRAALRPRSARERQDRAGKMV